MDIKERELAKEDHISSRIEIKREDRI